jgi:hypothetical protein
VEGGGRRRQVGGERRGIQQRGRTRKTEDSYDKHDFVLSSGRVTMTTGDETNEAQNASKLLKGS